MSAIRKMFESVVLAAALGLSGAAVTAAPVPFNITAAWFTAGSGYGMDANEASGTQLDVRFSTSAFVTQSFSLDLPSPDSKMFLFGTVDLQEPNAHGGINSDETDGLGVTASFTFVDPLGSIQELIATGTAFLGNVSGQGGSGEVDYTLTWDSIDVAFQSNGLFRIDLAPLSFSGQGSKNLNATVTLLRSPEQQPAPIPGIPEPAPLALIALGLAGLGFVARRRKRVD